jgi:hypothetical protein
VKLTDHAMGSAEKENAGCAANVGKANVGKANVGKANVGKANVGKANVGKASVGKASVMFDGRTEKPPSFVRKTIVRRSFLA